MKSYSTFKKTMKNNYFRFCTRSNFLLTSVIINLAGNLVVLARHAVRFSQDISPHVIFPSTTFSKMREELLHGFSPFVAFHEESLGAKLSRRINEITNQIDSIANTRNSRSFNNDKQTMFEETHSEFPFSFAWTILQSFLR